MFIEQIRKYSVNVSLSIKYRNMKKYLVVLFSIIFIGLSAQKKSFYDYKVKTIDGKEFDLSTLKGKKVLIVNTASKCGNTPQYEDLEKLYLKYHDIGFEIIAFPANNFKNQEPGTNEDIKQFCRVNYNVTFPLMEKISVKGEEIHPLYKWLTSKDLNGKMDSEVHWNFQKYMISESGELVDYVMPKEKPFCDKIIKWLEN